MSELASRRTRRSLLAGAAAASATSIVALARPVGVLATGATVTVDDNTLTGSGTTGITSSGSGATIRASNTYNNVNPVFNANACGLSADTVGDSTNAIVASATGAGAVGVYAHTTGFEGTAVKAVADGNDAYAVDAFASGTSGSPAGVIAGSVAPGGFGVTAEARNGGIGVRGASWGSSGDVIPPFQYLGVFGYAVATPTSMGVYGLAAAGTGVRGEASGGIGVAAIDTTGTALKVSGRAKFNRSGKASVGAGKTYVDVAVPGGISANTIITASLQTYRGTAAVACVRPNYPVAGKARIYLTKVASTTASSPVGWIATEYGV